MRMGVHQARQHQAPGSIETMPVGCKRQGLTNSPDALCFDKNIGTFKNLMVWFACEKLAWEMARDLSGRAPPGIRGGKARKPRGRTV